jgi:drug/metabolite transporter (DMT)-like permease
MGNLTPLLGFVAILSVGNLLFKQAAKAVNGNSLSGAALLALQQPAFYGALILYGASTFLWVWILSRMPLSSAYPFMALPMIVVPVLAVILFGEAQAVSYWLGTALIAIGIIVSQA